MNTLNNEHDDFIQELIESIYIQFEQSTENLNKQHKFRLIIKGVIDFLKENELSIDAIRTGLIEFFHLRRSYIRSEYQLSFHQIGIIVENYLSNGTDDELNTALENNTNNTATAASSQSSMSSITSLAFQLLSQSSIYDSQPIVYTYQPYMGLPTINVPVSNLDGLAEPIPPSNLNVANSQNLNDVEDNDAPPPLIPSGYNSIASNLLLNFVNIYLNGSVPPLAPMVDVKNVVTEKQLEQLKVVNWSELKPEETEKYKDCVICLDSFENDSKLRILKCDHGFHVDCIDKWLTDCNYKCPVCRDDSNDHHAEI